MAKIKRYYRQSDVDMLIAASAMVESAREHKEALCQSRSTYTDAYFDKLEKSIGEEFEQVGTDAAEQKKEATKALNEMMKAIIRDVVDFRTHINNDFKRKKQDKQIIFDQLGFNECWPRARRSQMIMTKFMARFHKGMTPELKARLVRRGMNAELIDRLSGYLFRFKDTNVSQKALKGSQPIKTAERVKQLNKLFDEVMMIGNIAKRVFRDEREKYKLFCYIKVVSRQSSVVRGGTGG